MMMLSNALWSWTGRLLGLDGIHIGEDAPVVLTWQWILPAWVLAPLCLAACVVVVAASRGAAVTPVRRMATSGLRIAMVVLTFLLLSQPKLTLQRERSEQAHVAILLDTSASMGLADGGHKRWETALASLTADEGAVLRSLATENDVRLYRFDADVSQIAEIAHMGDAADALRALAPLKPDGPSTDIQQAMRAVLSDESERMAAVVLISDGRDRGVDGRATSVMASRWRRVPVHTVLLGSPEPRPDLFVGSVQARDVVSARDRVMVTVDIGSNGLPEARSATLTLYGEDGSTLAERSVVVDPDEVAQRVTLAITPTRPGDLHLRVEVGALEGELIRDNNTAALRIRVVDRQMSVLYVDGYPRYEYRYLKNALLREPTIRSSCLLLSADMGFAQEGSDPIAAFPTNQDDLNAFDLVIWGDVDPDDRRLGPDAASLVREFVANRGGGLVVMAGPASMPFSMRGTALEQVLPVRLGSMGQRDGLVFDAPQPLSVTPEGRDEALFRLDADRAATMVADWSGAYWTPPLLEVKPGATILAERRTDVGHIPTIVRSRFGGGRVLYVGTDETWRWRQDGRDWLFDAFWLQVCRSVAALSTERLGIDAILTTDRRDYGLGDEVLITLDRPSVDTGMTDDDVQSVLCIDPAGDIDGEVRLVAIGDEGRLFDGAFVPARSGEWRLRLADNSAEASFRVVGSGDELRHPEANHELLRKLAARTGGEAIGIDGLPALAAGIPNCSVRIPDDITEPIWDSYLSFGLFGLLLSTEWVCRKLFGMV